MMKVSAKKLTRLFIKVKMQKNVLLCMFKSSSQIIRMKVSTSDKRSSLLVNSVRLTKNSTWVYSALPHKYEARMKMFKNDKLCSLLLKKIRYTNTLLVSAPV